MFGSFFFPLQPSFDSRAVVGILDVELLEEVEVVGVLLDMNVLVEDLPSDSRPELSR